MKQKIEIEVNIPDGWEFVRFDTPKEGEQYLNANTHEIKTTQSGRIDRGNRIIIKPIKSDIEIPQTPFWVEESDRSLYTVTGGDGVYYLKEFGDSPWKEKEVYKHINSGAWKIVPEPKKEMRPYTEEEWREWFLNDGALIHNETGVIWKPISMRKDISFFEYSEDGDRDRPVWMSKEKVLERYIDRNGNKFEKEVEK